MLTSNLSLTCVRSATTGIITACVLVALSCCVAVAQSNDSARPAARLITAFRSAETRAGVAAHRVGSTVAPAAPKPHSAARTAAGVSFISSDENRIYALINDERRALGFAPLALDAELCRVARLHSGDMASNNFLNHTDSRGFDAAGRAREAGVSGWRALGENIALNQGFDDPAAFAVERWMKSAKHRANVTNSAWTHTGLGVARAADGTFYFTQVFVVR